MCIQRNADRLRRPVDRRETRADGRRLHTIARPVGMSRQAYRRAVRYLYPWAVEDFPRYVNGGYWWI